MGILGTLLFVACMAVSFVIISGVSNLIDRMKR